MKVAIRDKRHRARTQTNIVMIHFTSIILPTALLAGATKAEAAATRRARRKRERILANKLLRGNGFRNSVIMRRLRFDDFIVRPSPSSPYTHGLSPHLRQECKRFNSSVKRSLLNFNDVTLGGSQNKTKIKIFSNMFIGRKYRLFNI